MSEVVAGNPQAVRAHYLRGLALAAEGSNDEGIKALQRVLELLPGSIPGATGHE